MKPILEEVLKGIKPSPKEEREVRKMVNAVLASVRKAVPEATVVLGGSGEKGTRLKGTQEADIFVKFPFSYANKDISSILGKKLKKKYAIKKLHGSRDYYQIDANRFIFEIIPIITIRNAQESFNITDVSPLHSRWVKKHRQYVDEIRLTKQFMKSSRVYGAESYINGFSGYICEVLTIHYLGFAKLVKAMAKWSEPVTIDTERHYKSKNIFFELNDAKRSGPLIVIDPVQSNRNAAAAVSREKFNKAIEYSKEFLSNPSKKFFEIRSIEINKVNKDGSLFVFTISPLSGKKDVIGCKLLKCFNYISQNLIAHNFSIIFSDWQWENKAEMYFEVKNDTLPEKEVIKGPPERKKDFSRDFRKKHNDVYEENGVLYAVEARKYTKPEDLLSSIVNDPYVNERVK